MQDHFKRSYASRAWSDIRREGLWTWLPIVLLWSMIIAHIGEVGWRAALLSTQSSIYVAILVLLVIYWRLFTVSIQLYQFQAMIDLILTDPDARDDGPILSEADVRRFRRWLHLDS
jgi:hypothetical protein